MKTEVLCNRGNPTVEFQLIPSVQRKDFSVPSRFHQLTPETFFVEAEKLKTITIDAKNLTLLELLKVTNEQVTARAPKEEVVSSLKTKSEKKAAGGRRK